MGFPNPPADRSLLLRGVSDLNHISSPSQRVHLPSSSYQHKTSHSINPLPLYSVCVTAIRIEHRYKTENLERRFLTGLGILDRFDFFFVYFEYRRRTYNITLAYSPISLTGVSLVNLVSIFRCSSSAHNGVHPRSVDSLTFVYSLSSHRYPYVVFVFSSRFNDS